MPAIIGGLAKEKRTIADSLATAEKISWKWPDGRMTTNVLHRRVKKEPICWKEAKENKDKMIAAAKKKQRCQAAKIISDAQASIHHQKDGGIN